MIPADHVTFNDEGTAWFAVPNFDGPDWEHLTFWHGSDRPCDTCYGLGVIPFTNDITAEQDCPDCIDGQHRFSVSVACDEPDVRRYEDQGWHNSPTCVRRQCVKGILTLRVSIVPGMILPIVNRPDSATEEDFPVIWMLIEGQMKLVRSALDHEYVKLPDAACPGMWAVQVRL